MLLTRLTGIDLAVALLGAAITLLAAYLTVRAGATVSVGLLAIVVTFVVAVIGFIGYPHLAVGGTIVLFALMPSLKVFISPDIGAIKDLLVLAATVAAAIIYVFQRPDIDRWVAILVVIGLVIYLINVGGGHGTAWAHGVRLVGEPLLLLLVGLTLPHPQRTFKYAMGALVLVSCTVAVVGILQQLVGVDKLVSLGYAYTQQVRVLPGGQLRSFGTLDDPFAYAALLSFGIVAVLFWMRRLPLAAIAGLLLLAGLGASLVRSAIVVLVGLGALALSRIGYAATAILVAAATLIAGGVILVHTSGTDERAHASLPAGGGFGESANLILNGRVSAWEVALGSNPVEWILGRGVGEVGTAAERATYTIESSSSSQPGDAEAVDSGYLATVADVGLVGLAVFLALYGRLLALGAAAARRHLDAGWVALGLTTVMLLDALTRASFTGFPTAFLGLLLVGVALAAARQERGSLTSPLARHG